MDDDGSGSPSIPRDLLFRILALLAPNDLALSGRLACKDVAQHFQGSEHSTVSIDQPLPFHVSAVSTAGMSSSLASLPTSTSAATTTESSTDTSSWLRKSTEEALRKLTFRRKLLLLSRAAASGCEANVELAWQLLQPHVFPEVLQSNFCHILLQQGRGPQDPAPDVGSTAVASGLAHMLPCLSRRCPGLLDPTRTMEAAAKHCDLAGLQAAWEAVGSRLRGGCERARLDMRSSQHGQGLWKCMLVAAAGSSTPDALAKMGWVIGMSGDASNPGALAHAYGAAAASGDLARVGWLQERGVAWSAPGVLEAVVKHADLDFIQRMDAEGGYLPPAHDASWSGEPVVSAAAAAPVGSVAKLRWLADRGAALGVQDAVMRAAERGDLEAVQLLVGHLRAHHEAAAVLPSHALVLAAASGSVPTARFLQQAGCGFGRTAFTSACARGHLPMVRWLAEAGCPVDWESMLRVWPRDSAADGEGLLQAIRVLAQLGSRVGDEEFLWSTALVAEHPWEVLQGLRQHTGAVPSISLPYVATAGCEATLRALVATDIDMDRFEDRLVLQLLWYAFTAAKGDLGTLTLLQRLGLQPEGGVVVAAVSNGAPLPALRWLTEHGARWTRSTIAEKLKDLGPAYPSQRGSERWEVEAWLRGLLGGEAAAATTGGTGPALVEQRQGQERGKEAGSRAGEEQVSIQFALGVILVIVISSLSVIITVGGPYSWAILAVLLAAMACAAIPIR